MSDDTYDPELKLPKEPLRERLPEYSAVFAVGLAAATIGGVVWGVATRASLLQGIGWSLMMLGVLMLLVGGVRGGGYHNLGLGAVGAMFGGRHRHDEEVDPARRSSLPRSDLHARLRAGLRPQANPTAFWQIIAGAAYIGTGVLVVEWLA